MDPTIVSNLGDALKAFFLEAQKQFGEGVNVYTRMDTLEVSNGGVESDVHVQVLAVNFITGEQKVLIPPPSAGQVSLGVPPELENSLKIGINS